MRPRREATVADLLARACGAEWDGQSLTLVFRGVDGSDHRPRYAPFAGRLDSLLDSLRLSLPREGGLWAGEGAWVRLILRPSVRRVVVDRWELAEPSAPDRAIWAANNAAWTEQVRKRG
jgi:hypothetical protein